MDTQEIVEIVGEIVPEGETELAQRRGSQALAVAQEMETALASRLEDHPAYASIWQAFRAAPEQQATVLVAVVQNVVQEDSALAEKLDRLLTEYRRVTTPTSSNRINTGGGAYVGGNVKVDRGDFVGRDKTTITGDGSFVGDHSQSQVQKTTGMRSEEVAALFDRALELARQKPPEVREDVEAAVEIARKETKAGEETDNRLLNRALDVLLDKGPDILELVIDAILNPGAAAGKGARMLARKAQETLQERRRSSS